MSASSSQIKLATKLHKHNLANATRNPMKTVIDLPLSMEMIQLLDNSLNTVDDDGCLPETVGSHLSHPLSAMSVYCPTAAVMASKYSAVRIPSPTSKFRSANGTTSNSYGFGLDTLFGSERNDETNPETSPTEHSPTTFTDYSVMSRSINFDNAGPKMGSTTHLHNTLNKEGEEPPKIDDAKSRLEVLWLRRKAELAREDGDINGAVSILQQALDEHLGGRDYINANLSKPILSNDPREILNTIQTQYFVYDTFAHSKADLIQRWYHRYHIAKCDRTTLISKIFRGYRKRKAYQKYKEMRRQCAVLLQRRFRKHLIRMHALATKIKRWYKLRKEVKVFQKRLHIFRMARRIQRLFRGVKGRRYAQLKKLQYVLVRKIQRTARAYILRQSRAWVLALFHERFWRAARTIQTFVRYQQAVARSQMKLLLELARENIRARKERIVVEEALRMQRIRNHYYFQSAAGRIHLAQVQRQLYVQSLAVKAFAPEMSPEDRLTQRLIAILEEYDTDGTGNISVNRLKKVLGRVLIPVDKEQLIELKHKFDPEDTGQVNFNDVIDWYNSEEADDLLEPEEFTSKLAQVKLEMRRRLRGARIHTSFHKAKKFLNAQHSAWLTKDTISTFRMTHPPKYQCCQCRRAFVMFTDYFVHFDAAEGNCGVSQEKGLFHPRYWDKHEWRTQRQLEHEIMRVNDEHPYVQYQAKVQICADLAHLQHNEVQVLTKALVQKTADIYKEDIMPIKKSELKKRSVQHVKDLMTYCECASVSVNVAECVTKSLHLPVSKAWITNDLCPLNDMVKWLTKYLKDYSESDHSSFSDNSSSVKLSDYFKPDDPKTTRHVSQFSLENFLRPPTVTDKGLLRRRARELGVTKVRFLRALHVDTQATLFALLEFRARRPRSISLTDDELQELGLISLTQEHHLTIQHELISRLKRINEMYVELHSHYLAPKCSLRRMFFRTPLVQPTDAKIDGTALFDLFIEMAHGMAAAHQHYARHSAIGAMVQRRLAADLKNTKHRLLLGLVDDLGKSTKYADASSGKILQHASVFGAEKTAAVLALEFQYCFGKYCSIFQDEGIDLRDMDLLAREFALHISAADKRVLAAELDPEGGGFIYFLYFLRWIRSDKPHMYLRESLRARLRVLRALQSATRSKYFFHAADVMLARYRSILRMEVTVREGILYGETFSEEQYIAALRTFYQRCEGGAVSEDLNARKYHIMPQSSMALQDHSSVLDDGSLASLGHNSLLEGAAMKYPPSSSGDGMERDRISISIPVIAPRLSAESGVTESSQLLSPGGKNNASSLTPKFSARSVTDFGGNSPMPAAGSRTPLGTRGTTSASPVPKTSVIEARNSAESAVSGTNLSQSSAGGKASVMPSHTPIISARNSAESPVPAPQTPIAARNSAESPAEAATTAANDFEGSDMGDEGGQEEEASRAEFVKPVIRGGLYENLTKWYTLKWRQEESENRVIYQVVEHKAARQYWLGLFTPRGQYNLWTERKLLVQLDKMVDAVGYCLPSKRPRTSLEFEEVTIQQALSFMQGTSISSLASSSLQNYSATMHNTLSIKEGPRHMQQMQVQFDNASISTHTHSLAFDDEEHPFAYLHPESVHGQGTTGSVHSHFSPGINLFPPSPGAIAGVVEMGEDLAGDEEEEESQGLLGLPPQSPTRKQVTWEEPAALSIHGAALHAAALEMAVSVFDTDCTGDLDEIEVRMLLRCLRCGLSEKAFRHIFADNDDVIRGVSVRRLLMHLRDRVRWNHEDLVTALSKQDASGMSIAKHANLQCAAGILVSLQRQLAHKRALQTVKLSKVGRIVMLRESHSGSSEQTLLVRSQLFAMRQVGMFIRTTQGRIKLQHVLLDVKFSWQRDVIDALSNPYTASSGAGFLKYAFSIHQEADGILVTELPHIVRFLIKRCKLAPTRRIEELSQLFCEIRGLEDIRTLSQAEFSGLLAPLFLKPEKAYVNSFISRVGLVKRLRRDARMRMLSCARQQAVMIAMEFPVVEVSETNYRCSVLGMHLFINESLGLSILPRKSTVKALFTFKKKEKVTQTAPAAAVASSASLAETTLPSVPSAASGASLSSDKRAAPKETMALYMLSLGYTVRDLSHSGLSDYVDVDHLEGHMPLEEISLAAATSAARAEIAKAGTYLRSLARAQRKVRVYAKYHMEFKRASLALSKYGAVVDKKGGEFLKEILTGVSHCLE